jgi:putative transposase
MFAAAIRKRRVRHRSYSSWRWHLDEVFVKFNGETHYLWRAVDHEGEVLEVFATKRRDRRSALNFLKRAMKRYGRPSTIVTDRLRTYGAAIKVIGIVGRQQPGRWLNNRAENSHQPFASIHNHFNLDRHLNQRAIFKDNRSAALAEWRQLAA